MEKILTYLLNTLFKDTMYYKSLLNILKVILLLSSIIIHSYYLIKCVFVPSYILLLILPFIVIFILKKIINSPPFGKVNNFLKGIIFYTKNKFVKVLQKLRIFNFFLYVLLICTILVLGGLMLIYINAICWIINENFYGLNFNLPYTFTQQPFIKIAYTDQGQCYFISDMSDNNHNKSELKYYNFSEVNSNNSVNSGTSSYQNLLNNNSDQSINNSNTPNPNTNIESNMVPDYLNTLNKSFIKRRQNIYPSLEQMDKWKFRYTLDEHNNPIKTTNQIPLGDFYPDNIARKLYNYKDSANIHWRSNVFEDYTLKVEAGKSSDQKFVGSLYEFLSRGVIRKITYKKDIKLLCVNIQHNVSVKDILAIEFIYNRTTNMIEGKFVDIDNKNIPYNREFKTEFGAIGTITTSGYFTLQMTDSIAKLKNSNYKFEVFDNYGEIVKTKGINRSSTGNDSFSSGNGSNGSISGSPGGSINPPSTNDNLNLSSNSQSFINSSNSNYSDNFSLSDKFENIFNNLYDLSIFILNKFYDLLTKMFYNFNKPILCDNFETNNFENNNSIMIHNSSSSWNSLFELLDKYDNLIIYLLSVIFLILLIRFLLQKKIVINYFILRKTSSYWTKVLNILTNLSGTIKIKKFIYLLLFVLIFKTFFIWIIFNNLNDLVFNFQFKMFIGNVEINENIKNQLELNETFKIFILKENKDRYIFSSYIEQILLILTLSNIFLMIISIKLLKFITNIKGKYLFFIAFIFISYIFINKGFIDDIITNSIMYVDNYIFNHMVC